MPSQPSHPIPCRLPESSAPYQPPKTRCQASPATQYHAGTPYQLPKTRGTPCRLPVSRGKPAHHISHPKLGHVGHPPKQNNTKGKKNNSKTHTEYGDEVCSYKNGGQREGGAGSNLHCLHARDGRSLKTSTNTHQTNV
jgi:hypothetical protein